MPRKIQPPKSLVDSAPKGTVWFGGPVDRSSMTLRITGDEFDPDEITRLLGCAPTTKKKKGDKRIASNGKVYVERFCSWRLKAPDSEGAKLDAQVEWLFSRLSPDLEIWQRLSSCHKIDLFSGLFMEASNRGIELSPKTLLEIGRRGIKLGFDIYGPADEE
jgi:hypothetical protein